MNYVFDWLEDHSKTCIAFTVLAMTVVALALALAQAVLNAHGLVTVLG